MCPRGEVIAEVSLQNPFQMPLAEHDHMIEAFPTNTTNEPFSEWILPRTLSRREHLCDAHSLNPVAEMTTIYSVTVSYQVFRRRIVREDFDHLLCRPFCRGMVGNIEMEHAAPLMREDHKDKQHFQL